jgi:site-specific DNA recombinase
MRYFLYCRKSSETEDRQVQSLESQQRELMRRFGGADAIEIVEILEESKSAQSLGRPVFNAMMARIEKGEARGIIAWAPDRLARNSMDGGRIIYSLDQGVLRDLKFATYTYENNSQGKFMLSVMFGQSKYYSDALGENVLRGNRTKIENGWRPNLAPIGYLNDRNTRTIVRDPVHFPLIRRLFDYMLTGSHTPRQLAFIARDEWHFRTPVRRKIGGVPLCMSSLYKILSNPFYAGLIVWNGQTSPGKHEAVVTPDEFDRVRRLLQQPSRIRPKTYVFPFTGLIHCGACGRILTAEHKRNRQGHRYIYYHCTKSRLGNRCLEPSIEAHDLDRQIATHLQSIILPEVFTTWLSKALKADHAIDTELSGAVRASLEAALGAVRNQLSELTDLRLRGLLDDAEFIERRRTLQEKALKLQAKVDAPDVSGKSIEPFFDLIWASNQAVDLYRDADDATKRIIVKTVLSNPLLRGKKLNVQAAKPFVELSKTSASTSLLAGVKEDRNLHPSQVKKIVAELNAAFDALPDRAEFEWSLSLLRTIGETQSA